MNFQEKSSIVRKFLEETSSRAKGFRTDGAWLVK